ncbi:hypothetical protein PTKIN_Ptkin05aG0024600 [Pterospermum kingtungense]
MDDVLIQISQAGDVNGLYDLIRKNPAVLKNIDKIMFEDTPLHIAASAGQTCFALEVMNLMPSFARKLNKDGLSPIHLALLKGHSELVLLLLRADRELVRVKGKGGMSPLHYAAKNGNIKLLAEFLAACPNSVEDVTVEALEVLVGWLNRVCHEDVFSWKTDILNWRNMQGNTVLDIAELNRQKEAIQLLAQINAKKSIALASGTNTSGWEERRNLRNMLRRAGYWPDSRITLADYLRSKIKFHEKLAVFVTRYRLKISEDLRNALLVVGGLIVAATFQSVFSPPGGLRQDNGNPSIMVNGTYINTTVTNTTDAGGLPSNDVGTSIMDGATFLLFFFFNSFILSSVVSIIGILLSDSGLGVNMSMMLGILLFCYGISISVISPDMTVAVVLYGLLVLFFSATLIVLNVYSTGMKMIQQLRYKANKCPN